MYNIVIMVTPLLAASVTETECVVTMQVRSLGLAHFPLQPYSISIVIGLCNCLLDRANFPTTVVLLPLSVMSNTRIYWT